MELSEFRIGDEFECDDRRWRCTDIGTRVIVAIRVDTVEVGGTEPRTLNQAQAEAEGWFNGPPYASPEIVFDEYDQEGCEPVAVTRNEREVLGVEDFSAEDIAALEEARAPEATKAFDDELPSRIE